MHSRINELEPQCWEVNEFGLNFNYQKFANLIVQDCLVLCTYDSEDDDNQYELGRAHKAKEIGELIKKHFGV